MALLVINNNTACVAPISEALIGGMFIAAQDKLESEQI